MYLLSNSINNAGSANGNDKTVPRLRMRLLKDFFAL